MEDRINQQKIFRDLKKVQKYAKNNFESICKEIESKTKKTIYVVGANRFGIYDKNYLSSIICGKKGKSYDIFPGKDCKKIFLAENDELLCMKSIHTNSFFDHETYYRVNLDDYVYYLYTFDNKFSDLGANYRAKYKDGKLVEWLIIESVISVFTYNYFENKKVEGTYTYLGSPEICRRFSFDLKNDEVNNLVEVKNDKTKFAPNKFTEWLDDELSRLNKSAIAFNVNIYENIEGYSAELVATSTFNEENEDWACDEIYSSRNNGIEFCFSAKNWKAALKFIQLELKEYLRSGKFADILIGSQAVACGFVDGDLSLIYRNGTR